jgi:hypothetical protein
VNRPSDLTYSEAIRGRMAEPGCTCEWTACQARYSCSCPRLYAEQRGLEGIGRWEVWAIMDADPTYGCFSRLPDPDCPVCDTTEREASP